MINKNAQKPQIIIADAGMDGARLDATLALCFPEHSRSYLQKLIRDGQVLAGGAPVKSSYRIHEGDALSCVIPDPTPLQAEPEDIPLDILYEDDDVIVVNKPKGMVVHPAPGHMEHTLVNALLYHCGSSLSGINGVLRPGIVHRIDRDTTGALVVCKNDAAHRQVAQQLKDHSITRSYRAIVNGVLKENDGTIDRPLGRHPRDRIRMAIVPDGKRAVTHYHVLQRFDGYSYIECRLETGRTHQIRVHMASIGHPVLGDEVYGPARCPFRLTGQTLHAYTLGFIHPTTGRYMEFTAPMPEYFTQLLEQLAR